MNTLDLPRLKADFERDGLVVLRGFVGPEVVEAVRGRVAKAVHALRRIGAPEGAAALAKAKGNRHPAPFGNVAKGLERVDDYFDEYLNRGEHFAVVEALIGEPPTPATAAYFGKDYADETVTPHHDGDNGATAWLALDATNEENGCLYFLKGSHRCFPMDLGKCAADLAKDPAAVAVHLQPGDMSIHDSRTIHWSGPNTAGKQRRGVNCFYQRTAYWHGDGKPGNRTPATVESP